MHLDTPGRLLELACMPLAVHLAYISRCTFFVSPSEKSRSIETKSPQVVGSPHRRSMMRCVFLPAFLLLPDEERNLCQDHSLRVKAALLQPALSHKLLSEKT